MGSAPFKAAIEGVVFRPYLERKSDVVPDDVEEHILIGAHSKIPVLIKRTVTRERPWILLFHGSAEDAMGSLHQYGRRLHRRLDVNIAIPEYQHYGRSSQNDDEHEEETPSEEGVYEVATLAYALLTRTLGVNERDIIAFGISLGGAAAAELASRGGIETLILQCTFLSIIRIRMRTPWSCACDPFQTCDKLGKISASCTGILILHGENDPVVPVKHAYAIADGLRESDGMRIHVFPGRKHGDLFMDASYYDVVKEFIDAHTRKRGSSTGLTMSTSINQNTTTRRSTAGAGAGAAEAGEPKDD